MSKRSYSKIIGATVGCFAMAMSLAGCSAPVDGENTNARQDGVIVTKKFAVSAKSFINWVEPFELPPIGGDPVRFAALVAATNYNFNENPAVAVEEGKFRIYGSFDLYVGCNGDVMEPSTFWYGNAYSKAGMEQNLEGEIDPLQIGAHAVFDDAANHIGYNIDFVLSGRPNLLAEPALLAVAVRFNRTIFQHTRVELRCSGGTPVATTSPQGSKFPSHRVWVDDADGGVTEFTTPQNLMRDLWLLPPTPTVGGSCSCDNSSCTCDGVAAPGGGGDTSECDCSGTNLEGYGVSTKVCGETVCAQDYQVWACTNNNYQPTGEACGGGDNGGGDNGGGDNGGGDNGGGAICECFGTNQEGGDASTMECGATVCSEDYQIWLCTTEGYQPTGTGC